MEVTYIVKDSEGVEILRTTNSSDLIPYLPVTGGNTIETISPELEPIPETKFAEGIETPSIIWPASLTHDYKQQVIDGVNVIAQISASPRKTKDEQDEIMREKKLKVDQIKVDLPALIDSDKQKDTAAALRMVAEILNLI